jgi:hypothetical protein
MKKCPDCGVEPGQTHSPGCDVERCSICKGQAISCGCTKKQKSQIWDGEWPGTQECIERGWYAVENQGRWPQAKFWVPCRSNTQGAICDMNRLAYFHMKGKDDSYSQAELDIFELTRFLP